MNYISKVGLVGLAMVFALAACSKSNQTSSTTTESSAAATEAASAPVGAASPGAMAAAGNASDGAKVYQTNCSSCHQATGAGVPGTFPPLDGNPVVTGDPKQVIHIVKYGLTGKIAVKGASYNGQMPAWGTQLSDADVASVVTYIRSAWSNKASPVTVDQVKAVAQ